MCFSLFLISTEVVPFKHESIWKQNQVIQAEKNFKIFQQTFRNLNRKMFWTTQSILIYHSIEVISIEG